MSKFLRNVGFYLLCILILITVISKFSKEDKQGTAINYTEFVRQIDDKKISKVTIQNNNIKGVLKDGTVFTTITPGIPNENPDLINKLVKEGVEITAENPPETPWWSSMLTYALPFLLIIGFWFFIMQQSQGGGGKVMSFGKSRAKMLGDKIKVKFSDVAGADEAKQELAEVVDFLKYPKRFNDLGARIPKGVLLFGPPGTGKTLLARAVAGEAGVPFFSISGSDFVEMFVGVGASRVRDLFEQAKKNSPCIVFIDEIDAVGRQRGAGLGGGHDEREQTLNQLLVEMDGFAANEGIIIIAATNRPDILDPALLRPGRFDRQIIVDRPDVRGREAILKVHTKGKPIADDVNLDVLARRTPGFTGADLSNLVNEAALLSARQNKKIISMEALEESIERVIAGPERKSKVVSEKERRLTAYHEGGHALIGLLLPNADPVHKVTIVPRGRAGGYTLMLPEEDRSYATRSQLLDELKTLLGGRVAEEVILKEISTGASNDLQRATSLVRSMITQYGMSEVLGPITYGQSQDHQVFLGRDLNNQRDYSEDVANAIDKEVRAYIENAYAECKQLLIDNIDKLHLIAAALLKYETIEEKDLKIIMEKGTLEGVCADKEPVDEKFFAEQDKKAEEEKTSLVAQNNEEQAKIQNEQNTVEEEIPNITEETKPNDTKIVDEVKESSVIEKDK